MDHHQREGESLHFIDTVGLKPTRSVRPNDFISAAEIQIPSEGPEKSSHHLCGFAKLKMTLDECLSHWASPGSAVEGY
jgi:hypothetical protein